MSEDGCWIQPIHSLATGSTRPGNFHIPNTANFNGAIFGSFGSIDKKLKLCLEKPNGFVRLTPMNRWTCIDLFCGCGGFSLGMERAGFKCLAAIDFNHEAVEVFKNNFPAVPQVLEKDLTKFTPASLAKLIGASQVDTIVGGPPCQGFSTARQRDGANHGVRLKEDPRRYLYQEFLRYVEFFQPKVFVMENVLGIRSASGGEYFTRVQKEARAIGYPNFNNPESCLPSNPSAAASLFRRSALERWWIFRKTNRLCPPVWMLGRAQKKNARPNRAGSSGKNGLRLV